MSLLKNKNTRTAVLLFATAAMSIIGCKKDPVVTPTPPTPPTPPTKTEVVLKINDFLPLSAKQEEEVTINGDGFTKSIDSVTVQFADGPAIKPKSTNGKQMIVMVPSSAKDGPLTVAVLNKTPVKSAQGFTYVPTTTNPGTNPGGNPGTNPGGNPGSSYVVKTVGIATVALTTAMVDGKLKALITKYSNGAGTVIDLREGTDLKVQWANLGSYSTEMNGNTPQIVFNSMVKKATDKVVDADTLTQRTMKITGFKNEAFNQLNLVLVDNGVAQAGKISYQSQPALSLLTNDNIQSSLNGTAKKQSITIQ